MFPINDESTNELIGFTRARRRRNICIPVCEPHETSDPRAVPDRTELDERRLRRGEKADSERLPESAHRGRSSCKATTATRKKSLPQS